MSKYVSPLEYNRKVFDKLHSEGKIMKCLLCDRYYEGLGYEVFPFYNIAYCNECSIDTESKVLELKETRDGFIKRCNELISLVGIDYIEVKRTVHIERDSMKTFSIYENGIALYSTNSMKALLNRLNKILISMK